jgi:hypothetical protein
MININGAYYIFDMINSNQFLFNNIILKLEDYKIFFSLNVSIKTNCIVLAGN